MPKLQDPSSIRQLAAQASLLAGALLGVLCTMTLATGVSQQSFESFMLPVDYAHMLVASGTPLRAIVAIDDLFIVAYVTAGVLVGLALGGPRRQPALLLVIVATIAAGVLDLVENHHILSMLRRAELGLVPSVAELDARVVFSSLKWLLGHAGFAVLGATLTAQGSVARALRFSLLFVQLPIGVLTLCVASPSAVLVLTWLRYGAFLSGFAAMGLLLRGGRLSSAFVVASGSSAPA